MPRHDFARALAHPLRQRPRVVSCPTQTRRPAASSSPRPRPASTSCPSRRTTCASTSRPATELFGSVTTIRFEQHRRPDVRGPEAGHGQRASCSTARPVDVDCLDRGRLPITTVAGDERARGRRRDAVPQRRRRAAPEHRPRGQAALRLRHVVHGRGAEHLRLLRPAGPEGAVHLPCPGPDGLDGHRQRPRRAGRARRVGVRADPAAVDVLRDARGRPVPRDHRRARRHPARAQCAAEHRQGSRRRRGRAVHDDPTVLRRVPPAVRDPLPVRQLPPGVRAGVQRGRDGEPRLRHLPRPDDLLVEGDPRDPDRPGIDRSPTRWRTSGSATSPRRSGGTTCGSTSRSPSTWATGSPPTSPSTTTPGCTTPTRAASGG